jgi:hypothetical protein
MAKKHRRRPSKSYFFKELILTILAGFSVGIVVAELFFSPTREQHLLINHADFAIACVFLLDFCVELTLAKNRRLYLRKNWYFLLAAIPITDSVAELLRGLRVLRLIRLIRVGEHLDLDFHSLRHR